MTNITPLTPRQTFEDNMRPAHLLLRVYRLLDSNDSIASDGDMVTALRDVVQATPNEDLMLIYNELFLGLVRERAALHISNFKTKSLRHMLRQAVVASCTALETYLLTSLRQNLPIVIRVRKRQFFPSGDAEVTGYFKPMSFTLDETLRVMESQAPENEIAKKILGFLDTKYLSKDTGVHICGALLGVSSPSSWKRIATHLNRSEDDLRKTLNTAVNRRNDIVHRADRSDKDPGGEQQEMTPAWAKQAVDTIDNVVQTFDDEITTYLQSLQAQPEEAPPQA